MTRLSRRSARGGVAALAVSGLLATGLSAVATLPTASAAPPPPCFTASDIADLAPGDAVTGKTVSQGTTPTGFTGTIEGVLEDGIAPGVDMVLADLTSPAITRAGGIWEGMSGSPVYDTDGDLIGAVSYGLGTGPSSIAGITPASEMDKLRDDANLANRRSPARRVALPRALAHRVAAKAGVSPARAAAGMHQLSLPISISGLSTTRLKKFKPVLTGLSGGQIFDSPAARSSNVSIPISVAGANMAAALSYGTVTASGLGTATAVCGSKILGFGHPMNFSGATTMTLHGASAVTIQPDPTVAGFKVANLGAPIGTVDQDRLAGIRGVTGPLPAADTTDVTSTTYAGSHQESGTSHVTVPDALTDLALTHIVTVADKAIDRTGKGSGNAGWTISGTRADGTPWSYSRRDAFADPEDITAALGFDVADDIDSIVNNPDEAVKVTSIQASSHLNDVYEKYAIAKVEVRSFGRWVKASPYEPVRVHAGYVVPLRYTLTSRTAPTRQIRTSFRAPVRAKNHLGWLHVTAGGYDEDSEDFFDLGGDFRKLHRAPSPSGFPALLRELSSRQQQNQIDTAVRFKGVGGYAGRRIERSRKIPQVVTGEGLYPLVALR